MLYPAPIRDLLLELAAAEMFAAHWTDRIHDEWIRSVLRDRPDLKAEQLQRTRVLMDAHSEDAVVEGYEPLIDSLNLPDPDDRHVLAAALRCQADAIVTSNLQDFPDDALRPWGLEAVHPDDFLINQFDLNFAAVCTAAKTIRQRLKSPARTADEYVAMLRRVGLPRTADRFQQCLPLI